MSAKPPTAPGCPVTVVVATRDRRPELVRTLKELATLPEQPPVIVVDNGSTDGSAAAVRARWPRFDVVALGRNLGAPARNLGVRRAATPYVAFADDDSWWAPGALPRAAELFEAHPRLGLIAAQVLVGPHRAPDPTSVAMALSPLAGDGPEGLDRLDPLPGVPVLGFLACGAVVRRDAFLQVGGFDDLLFFFGEEALVAMDLVDAGWAVRYVDDVVALHHPRQPGDPTGRRSRQLRNQLLTTWMRRPAPIVARDALCLVRRSLRDPSARRALAEALPRLPAAHRRRRVVSAPVEALLRRLE